MIEVQHRQVTDSINPYFNGMEMQARVAYIASVHFEDLTKQIGMIHYPLPAPEKGKVSVLEVRDTMTLIRQAMPDPNEEPIPTPAPMSIEVLVKSLLKEWTEGFIGMAGMTRPGIMQIAGPTPTQAEYDKLMEMEFHHASAWVKEADFYSITGQGRSGKVHVNAAKWLGLHRTGQQRKWLSGQGQEDFKIGAASGMQIPMTALQDGSVYLPKFYVENELDPIQFGDTFVAKFLATKRDPAILETGASIVPVDSSLDNELDGIEIETPTIKVKKN
jgi:hypothetical protein